MSLRKQVISAMKWSYMQQFSSQFINFTINLILARILEPEDFGTIALLYIFITIGNALIDGGMSSSLIRTKDAKQEDFDTVFLTNILFSLILYLIIFFTAPYVEIFYGVKDLSFILRVFSCSFIISSFGGVQRVLLIKQMKFKQQMIIALPSIILSGSIGVCLACFGFGVWSLIWITIIRELINNLQLWFYSDWKPTLFYDKKRFKIHFSFGFKLAIVEVIRSIFVNIYPILIGKFYSVSQVGLFRQADTLKQLPVSNISGALKKVIFPVFAEIQNNNSLLKKIYVKITVLLFSVLCPMFVFMSILSKPIVLVLLTEKWIEAAPFLSILSFVGLFSVFNIFSSLIINVKNKSIILLFIEIFEKLFTIILIVVLFKFGIYALILSAMFMEFTSTILRMYFTGRIISYPLFEQFKNVSSFFFFTILSSLIVFLIYNFTEKMGFSIYLQLIIPTLLGLTSYISLYYIFKQNVLYDFIHIFKK